MQSPGVRRAGPGKAETPAGAEGIRRDQRRVRSRGTGGRPSSVPCWVSWCPGPGRGGGHNARIFLAAWSCFRLRAAFPGAVLLCS